MYNLQHPSGWFCSMTPQIYFVLKSELKPGWLSLHLPHYICHVCLHFVTCLSYQIFNMILVYFMSYVQKQHNKYDISYMTFAIYYLWKESFKYDITLLPTLSSPPPPSGVISYLNAHKAISVGKVITWPKCFSNI